MSAGFRGPQWAGISRPKSMCFLQRVIGVCRDNVCLRLRPISSYLSPVPVPVLSCRNRTDRFSQQAYEIFVLVEVSVEVVENAVGWVSQNVAFFGVTDVDDPKIPYEESGNETVFLYVLARRLRTRCRHAENVLFLVWHDALLSEPVSPP